MQVVILIEQRTENPCVGGSIPPRATFKTLLNWGGFWLHLIKPDKADKCTLVDTNWWTQVVT